MIKPAIVAIGYNRPFLMKRLLESIGAANYQYDDITLIVSIDESNLSNEVEDVAKGFQWNYGEKIIRRFPQRQGLRKHIVQCGDYSAVYGSVIILEDDLIVSKDFYTYVCQAHEFYMDEECICGISLYSHNHNQFNRFPFVPSSSGFDVYLGGMVVTWGQSWTHKQWSSFKEWYIEHEDKLPSKNYSIPDEISTWNRSWGKYFASYMAENQLFYVYPYIAHSTCSAEIGEHNCAKLPINFVQVPLAMGSRQYSFGNVNELVKYDSFYDRIFVKSDRIAGIDGDCICVDLNNMKHSSNGKKYVLTNEKMPYIKVASYGLSMKPIEANILSEYRGDDLFLYELEDTSKLFRTKEKRPYRYEYDYLRYRYEYSDLTWRVALKFGFKDLWKRIVFKFSKKKQR